MNRVIRFNAWLPELQYMLEDVTFGHGTIGFPFIDEPEDEFYQFLKSKGLVSEEEDNLPNYIYDTGEDWGQITDDKHFVLLQCTGRKDNQGKFIYEGDVVKCDGGSFNAEVVYVPDLSMYCLETHRGELTRNNPNELYLFDDAIVIGNKFQNPELIKV